MEQLGTIVVLQPLNVIAQRLLGDKQPVGRAGYVQVLGQLREILLYTLDAAEEEDSVDLGGVRGAKKKQ